MDAFIDGLSDKKRAAESVTGLLEGVKTNISEAEPVIVNNFDKIVELFADKSKVVKEDAYKLSECLFETMSPFAISLVFPVLIQKGLGVKAKPPQKEQCLKLVIIAAKKFPQIVAYMLVDVIPAICDLVNDLKKEVKLAAGDALEAVCQCTGNKDLEPFIPYVIEAAKDPEMAEKCVEKLASCVFVQNVEAPALAATTPVLVRGLRDRKEELKRTCCVIIDNMCKLVEDPREVQPLMPRLEPMVKTAKDSIADPEARSVAEKSHVTLMKAAGEGAEVVSSTELNEQGVLLILNQILGDESESNMKSYVVKLATAGTKMRFFKEEEWKTILAFIQQEDKVQDLINKLRGAISNEEEEEEDDEEGLDLYKGCFSLAYGTLTLLRETKMHLKRQKFYGLLGPNNCGKTTLMRAIAQEQLDGFPKRDELKSIFVEHEIEEREVGVQDDGFPIMNIDLSGIDWVIDTCNNVYKLDRTITREEVAGMLKEIGFGKDRAADPDSPVTTYSGGWKMKMQLCAAALMNCDVLMLDEPTGHLDVDNIKWLENWLHKFPGSIICTSHDSSFLDKMCTHIIDFQDRKLKTFRGELGSVLTTFVEKYPEKKGYFELKNDVVKFVFPEPGALEGVKSRTKVILKMTDVTFQYPTKDTPTIFDINLKVSQVSRVAVIGANGAGKSTAIKVLVGEMTSQIGTVWKTPGMRMAYVAQHAFHHLEKHLDKTPSQYVMWRFAGNDDKESLDFKSKDLTVDEAEARNVKWCMDPTRLTMRKVERKEDEKHIRTPEAIMNRKNNKKEKTFEYEVKFQFLPIESNAWIQRDILVKMGYLKLVQREDEKQAAMSGLMTKQLTAQGVEKHLMDFGLDAETVSHTQIRHLSGGQKVKVVLGAAMWQNPHLLILDEPTNYLDRDGLGALTLAIRDYKGGVLVISHNREFCAGVAQEKWIMQGGKLRIEGESIDPDADKNDISNKVQEDVLDAFGNKIEVKNNKILSEKDKKKKIKDLEKKIKDGKKKGTLTEEEIWELEDQLVELKD